MKGYRFLVLFLALALLLQACGGNTARWGHFQVALTDVKQTDRQWSANLTVTNATDTVQSLSYVGKVRYVLTVKKGDEVILEQGFDPRPDPEKAETVNLAKGVSKKHIVVWTYRDQKGDPVEPGTYTVTVHLNAVTRARPGEKAENGLVVGKTVGPVRVTVK